MSIPKEESTVGDYSLEDLEERADRSYLANKDYIDNLLVTYSRKYGPNGHGKPVVAFLGFGRSGKDTAARMYCEAAGRKYVGSTSNAILPVIAHSIGLPAEQVFAERHQHREFWFHWCNAFRRHYPSMVAKMLLAEADVLVGLRGLLEFESCRNNRVFDLSIWVERPGVGDCGTVAFDKSMCDLVLHNDGTEDDLAVKVQNLAKFGR